VTREEIKAYVMDCLGGRMTCVEFVEMVTDYLEGSMSLWMRVRFHLHLGLCFGCRVHLKQMQQTIQTLGRLPEAPVPPEVRAELLRRFRHANPKSS
jgi:predicted anti-sigma-YlaC factor YlaD